MVLCIIVGVITGNVIAAVCRASRRLSPHALQRCFSVLFFVYRQWYCMVKGNNAN